MIESWRERIYEFARNHNPKMSTIFEWISIIKKTIKNLSMLLR
jgi:hypothetical protein